MLWRGCSSSVSDASGDPSVCGGDGVVAGGTDIAGRGGCTRGEVDAVVGVRAFAPGAAPKPGVPCPCTAEGGHAGGRRWCAAGAFSCPSMRQGCVRGKNSIFASHEPPASCPTDTEWKSRRHRRGEPLERPRKRARSRGGAECRVFG